MICVARDAIFIKGHDLPSICQRRVRALEGLILRCRCPTSAYMLAPKTLLCLQATINLDYPAIGWKTAVSMRWRHLNAVTPLIESNAMSRLDA